MVSEGERRYVSLHREQLIDVLKAAFVQGRLGKDEFDLWVGRAFAARASRQSCGPVR